MKPKLTIGFATFDDWHGAYFTLQALRMYHDLSDVELLVVDNCPIDNPQRKANAETLRGLLEGWIRSSGIPARYLHAPEMIGTSAPRDRVFREASGAAVLCIDSHVLLWPGAVQRLIRYYEEHPDSTDLVCGPILWDDLKSGSTHFDDQWRGEMWGTWGQAWQTPCLRAEHVSAPSSSTEQHVHAPSPLTTGDLFSVVEGEDKQAKFLPLAMNPVPITSSGRCGVTFPSLPYAGHEKALVAAGYRRMGVDPNDVFEVPGQGLGLFSCRKEAWPGFNPHALGFGGEEMYIHEKFRQRGDRTLCLGFLKWGHRFHRGQAPTYPLTRWNKVRNYVLELNELGLPLNRVKEHFVDAKLMPAADWEYLVADPVRHVLPPPQQAAVAPARAALPSAPAELFTLVKNTPRDLDKHMPMLFSLADGCRHVTEFSKRKESAIVWAAPAGVQRVISYNTEADDLLLRHLLAIDPRVSVQKMVSRDVPAIEPTDLLFIDSEHTTPRLLAELRAYAPNVSRYIVMHDTGIYGQTGEDNGPGLLTAIRTFLDENPQWFAAYHTQNQYGLTVLGRREEDRPEKPVYPWGFGPGTELKAILRTLGINPGGSCDCNSKANKMDEWGVEGCRANRETILTWMREGQGRWGWKDKLAAAAKAVTSGIAFKLDWSDPFPSLIDEAIRRANDKLEPERQKMAA